MFDNLILPNKLLPIFKPELHGIIQETRAIAMISRNRMQNLHRMIKALERDGIEGDIVETGVAKGGSDVFFGMLIGASPMPRELWLYDAFELYGKEGAGVYDDVHRLIYETFGFGDNTVHLIKGFFQDTLGAHPSRPIALLHVDADNGEAIRCCVDALYQYVVGRGWVVFDNYGHAQEVADEVDRWVSDLGLSDDLKRFGSKQAYLRKPAS